MKPSTSRLRNSAILLGALLACVPGCQDENTQFIKDAPQGPKPEFPNETFAEQRARLNRAAKAQPGAKGATNPAPSK